MKKFSLILFILCCSLCSVADNSKNDRSSKSVLSGKVVDSMGQEVAGAKVIIHETGETVYTDFNGCFKIAVNKNDKYALSIEMIGFTPKVVHTDPLESQVELVLMPLGTQQYR